MSAAKPSKATLKNTLSAIIDAGRTPGRIHVNDDGSFYVKIINIKPIHDLGNSKEVLKPKLKVYGQKR
jgi:hypothetical protein